jgi:hypothetical protein
LYQEKSGSRGCNHKKPAIIPSSVAFVYVPNATFSDKKNCLKKLAERSITMDVILNLRM